MKDIVEKAAKEYSVDCRRKAVGEVYDTEVKIVKESYQTQLRGKKWRVGVYPGGRETRTESKSGMTAQEADRKFTHLMEKHDMDEVETD